MCHNVFFFVAFEGVHPSGSCCGGSKTRWNLSGESVCGPNLHVVFRRRTTGNLLGYFIFSFFFFCLFTSFTSLKKMTVLTTNSSLPLSLPIFPSFFLRGSLLFSFIHLFSTEYSYSPPFQCIKGITSIIRIHLESTSIQCGEYHILVSRKTSVY